MTTQRPAYLSILLTFARNSLVREMSFRLNFLIECISSLSWAGMNLGFYLLVFQFTKEIGHDSGWHRWEFFIFLATTMIVNSLVQAFFMPNCEEFSELIRSGHLDFAILKPIDTQFLISLQKVDWSALANFLLGLSLLAISLWNLTTREENPLTLNPLVLLLYPFYVLCGVTIMYSLMISLSATSIWLGRNQTLYDFWFYITNFSRYPREIYSGDFGTPLRIVFTYLIPVLVVINVPARLLALPLTPEDGWLALFALAATIGSLVASRFVFQRAMASYRSASS